MSVLENLIVVAQHNALMRASGYTRARRARLRQLPPCRGGGGRARARLARPDRPDRAGRLERRATCPTATSAGSRSRAPCAPQPKLLCLDEPAAGLNPRETAELGQLLMRIRDEFGIGVLLIEHDMSVVMGISDHIVVLDYGRKIADGAPDADQARRQRDQGLSRRDRGGGAAARGRRRSRGRAAVELMLEVAGRPRPLRQHRGAARRQHPGRARRDRHHHRRQRRRQVDPADDHLRPAQAERRRRSSSTASGSTASSPTRSSPAASRRRRRAGASSRR